MYSDAIAMAFEANLLVVAGLSVYHLLKNRGDGLFEKADKEIKTEHARSAHLLRKRLNVVKFWGKARQVFWWSSIVVGLLSATFLYVISWHPPDSCTVSSDLFRFLKWGSVYGCPALLISMISAGSICNWLASNLNKDIQDQTDINEENEKQMAKAKDELRRLSREQGNPDNPNSYDSPSPGRRSSQPHRHYSK